MNASLTQKNNFWNISGFSLIELMLGLAISMAAIAASISSMTISDEHVLARSSADHIKSVGLSTAAYISERRSSLTQTTGSQNLSVQTLKSLGFLQASFVEANPWGSDYSITIKTSSSTSSIEALIVTNPAKIGNVTRIDIAGKTASMVGVMGGYSNVGNEMLGKSQDGTIWTRTSSEYPSINNAGQIGILIDSHWLDPETKKFLRRDGMNAMTGNLAMGNNNIVSGKDLNGKGSIEVVNTITSDTATIKESTTSLSATINKMVSAANASIGGLTSALSIRNVREYDDTFDWIPIIIGIVIFVGTGIPPA